MKERQIILGLQIMLCVSQYDLVGAYNIKMNCGKLSILFIRNLKLDSFSQFIFF